MKLGVMKQTVIEHGHPKVTKNDLVFPSNICPECGYDIPPSNRNHIDYYDFANSKCFINFKGKRAVFNCPECGCEFKREIIYEKHFDKYYFKHKSFGIAIICFSLGLLLAIIFAILDMAIPAIISTIIFIICFIWILV
jgi:hypothetical protein